MDRKDFIDRMQRAIVSAAQRGTVAPEDTVEYNGHAYYPCGYILTSNAQGQFRHLVRLHDLHANSIIEGELDKVNGYVSPDRLTDSRPIAPYAPPSDDTDKDKTIAELKTQLEAAIADLKGGRGECGYCKHDEDGPMKEICRTCDVISKSNWEWRGVTGHE